MVRPFRQFIWMPALLASLLLSACGGGGDGAPALVTTSAPLQETGGPAATGNTATDGINWFNYRRQQIGLPVTTRNAQIDAAAQGHSDYQRQNGITHDQVRGRPGFTGVSLFDRLTAAGYRFPQGGYTGEVIVRTGDNSGFNAAEDLVAAIYHRFVIFEPVFKEIGAASSTASTGSIYITTNFAVNGLRPVLGTGNLVTYPFNGQQRVPTNFFSDSEEPDPVPDRNEVGYPISVHADITSTVNVQSFTVRPSSGNALPVRLLDRTSDPHMIESNTTSAASIIPLSPLAPNTSYEVRFTGNVDGVNVDRSWSFRTQ
ncbi:MAG TPA: CAP domain-containing protein [Noviherbaspirillum sp.]|uniref:CAP domain-containing protein n=1 Tax=Noviherbaspirillum sp. TaxID=1926288 RepID=UPI002DDD8B1D|nr:CAP domain-containing protein [Noviherbaspirillum sp.]HEV2612277.1 CAP domain-containing protein [Noviherbaspirillum sp.]